MDKTSNEIWKPVVGYDGFYEVSSVGRVRSVYRVVRGKYGKTQSKPGRLLKPATNKDGYYYVTLSKEAKAKHFFIHRLVATAFIQNSPNKEQVNHINEDIKDNRVENLEWVTSKENINHGTRTLRMALTRRQFDRFAKPVLQISAETKRVIAEYRSIREAYRETGADRVSIYRCCSNKQKKAKGFLWKYK